MNLHHIPIVHPFTSQNKLKVLNIGGFPKIGVPPKSSILIRFSLINQQFLGIPHLWKSPLLGLKPTANHDDETHRFPQYQEDLGMSRAADFMADTADEALNEGPMAFQQSPKITLW